MKPIETLMLAVLVADILVCAFAVAFRKPTAARPRPIFTTLGFSLLIVAMTSWNIADKHAGDVGSQLLMYGSPLAMGFGLAMFLVAIRERRFGVAG